MTTLNELRDLTVEERKQQRPYVAPVNISIRHDDDAVITQFGDVEVVFADAGTQGGDQGADFRGGHHFVEAGLLDVQDLALQGQDGLSPAVPSLFRGATGGVILDKE